MFVETYALFSFFCDVTGDNALSAVLVGNKYFLLFYCFFYKGELIDIEGRLS